jgi:hypothetical protein
MGDLEPKGTYKATWQPTITKVTDNGICVGCLVRGHTYSISGKLLTGLSQGGDFGDDFQDATNYPLVRITNCITGNIYFARTHGFTPAGVATGATIDSAQFDVLSDTEPGESTLVVISDGIPSKTYTSCGSSITIS